MKGVNQSLIALAAAAVIAGGCASATGTTQRQNADAAGERTMIRVNNHNWSDMTVYLVRNGARMRLGSVSSLDTRTFEIPMSLLASTGDAVRLMADPIGSTRVFTSPPLLIAPGQRAEWRLENSLALSSFWIR
jgi:hypothetical protein